MRQTFPPQRSRCQQKVPFYDAAQLVQYLFYMKASVDIQRLSLKSPLQAQTEDVVAMRREIIEQLNRTRKQRLEHIQRELQERQLQGCLDEDEIYVEGHSIEKEKGRSRPRVISESYRPVAVPTEKNAGIGEIERMAFDKKFKNYLNHKQEFMERAKRRQEQIIEKRRKIKEGEQVPEEYFNEKEVLSNTGSEYQYKDAEQMEAAYETLATGKRNRKGGVQLFYAEKFEFAFRLLEFQSLLSLMEKTETTAIYKQLLLEYLFDDPMIMMLYSINPYEVADEISELQTQVPSMLNFEEFSAFLLADREPTYFEYTEENLLEARSIGRGLKCAPIVAKWIGEQQLYEQLLDIFSSVDMFGNQKAERNVLAKKLTVELEKRRLINLEVAQIVNINKLVPLSRFVYEIEHAVDAPQMITRQEFQQYLLHYHRMPTPDKDKLVTKLILAGKYDTSYIYVVNQEVLDLIKQVFGRMQKFAEHFVRKQKFIEKFVADRNYDRLKNNLVRSQTNRYVEKETVEDTLVRLLSQADNYVDIQELLDFFTNRGRPRVVEHHVYLQNLERQLAIIEEQEAARQRKFQQTGEEPSESSDEQFQRQIRLKKIGRKQKKIAEIRKNFKYDYTKKFNVTIPVSFNFDTRSKKVSIRQQKVRQMLQEKRAQQDESMKPIPRKEVPNHVKQNLYQKLLRDQERQRKQRLERFRLQIQNSMANVSQRLTKLKTLDIHCGEPRQPYQFVAKPMPWYCEVNLLGRINKQKQERRERILQQIINRHHDNDLPEGVLRMLQRHEQLQEKRQQNRSASTTSVGECTFIPKISDGVPDFQAIHERLKVDLQNAKQQKEPIKPEPFSFENREKKSKSHMHCLDAKPHKLSHSRQYVHKENYVEIRPTEKFEGLVQKRKLEREQKQKKIEQEEQKNQIRKMRQEKFAPKVRKVLQQNQNQLGKSRKQMLERIKQFQRIQRKKARDYENKMIEIYTKVWNRPLLIESNQFGQNKIKNNPRFQQEELQYAEQDKELKETAARDAKRSKQADARTKKEREQFNQEYDEKRRRAVEQPPGQYLIEQEQSDPMNHEEYFEGHEGEGSEDEFQQEYLEHGGLRTS